MKFFIINSFRMIVYIAYFAIIAVQTLGSYISRADIAEVFLQLTGDTLNDASTAAISIVWGLLSGWLGATLICGLLGTLLDIRDDINDRLPNARAK